MRPCWFTVGASGQDGFVDHRIARGAGIRDAITHYRQLRELTQDELAYVLLMLGHDITVDGIIAMEDRTRPVTVDDLTAIAFALNVTPNTLLGHIPMEAPVPDGPIVTGLPADVSPAELRSWLAGASQLDHLSRLRWAKEQVSRLRMRATHYEEQLQAGYMELHDLGELAEREADAGPVQALHVRIRECEYDSTQTDLALALAQRHLDHLRDEHS